MTEPRIDDDVAPPNPRFETFRGGLPTSGVSRRDVSRAVLSRADPSRADADRNKPHPDDGPAAAERTRGRRALWISMAGIAAVTAAAIPVVYHFTHATHEVMHTPTALAGLTLDTSRSATETSDYLRTAVAAGMALDSSVGAVYTDGTGDAHSVIFIGGTLGGALRNGSADEHLTTLFGLMNDSADHIGPLTAEAPGTLGGEIKCGISTDTSRADSGAAGDTMAVCGWADDSTVGIGLFPNRTVDQAATLLREMRPGLQASA